MGKQYFNAFNIAGFNYYDGAIVFQKLKIGTKLRLVLEPTNIYDDNAIALYYKKHKIGFVPKSDNHEMAAVLKAGHNIFKAYIQKLSPDAEPYEQVRIVVFVKGKKTIKSS